MYIRMCVCLYVCMRVYMCFYKYQSVHMEVRGQSAGLKANILIRQAVSLAQHTSLLKRTHCNNDVNLGAFCH